MKNWNWPKIKSTLIPAFIFILYTTVMISGFWLLYAIVWQLVGLPLTNWSIWILWIAALISERLFQKELTKNAKKDSE